MKEQVIIGSRFCGPPDSGNGGYTCGVVANFIDGAAEVTLRRPPPLNRPLNVEKVDDEKIILYDENGTIAEAIPTKIEIEIPKPPSFSEAEKLTTRIEMIENHLFPTCFVCGPKREEFDGLRIFPGPVKGASYIAAPWIPDPSLSDDTGKVRDEIIWATLDCPGGWATVQEKVRFSVLGRLAATITNRVKPGDKCLSLAGRYRKKVEK